MKKHLTSFFKLLFSASIIYWLVSSGRFSLSSLKSILDLKLISVCLLLVLLSCIAINERWLGLLQLQNFATTRYQAWKLSMIGMFFNFVVPGGVGGDLVKAFYIAKDYPQNRTKAVVTVLMDRLIGLYTMLVMAIAVMLWDYDLVKSHEQLTWLFYLLLLLFISFSLFWAIIFSRRISNHKIFFTLINCLPKKDKLLKTFQTLTSYAHSKSILFKSVTMSVFSQFAAIILFIVIGRFIGFEQISMHIYFFVVPIGFMATAIPIAPAGIGVGQAAFYYLFNLASKTDTQVGILTITSLQIFQFIMGLLGAWYYVHGYNKIKIEQID